MKNQRKQVAIVLSFLFLLLTGTAAGQPSTPAQPNPLEPLARLAGGEWLGQFKMPNGTTSDVRNVFEWGLNGKILKARYFCVNGANHFEIVETLADPASPICRAALSMLQ